MILRPKPTPSCSSGLVPVWHAVSNAQKANAASYHLVRQPDHALLSGQIAERFAIAGAPAVDDDLVRGISLHDEGWRDFDDGRQRLQATFANYSAGNVALNLEGKPLSFLEIKAEDFLRAWNGSIAAAEAVAPIAGLIVSGHFRRIGQFGMSTGAYSGGDTQRVQEFFAREESAQSPPSAVAKPHRKGSGVLDRCAAVLRSDVALLVLRFGTERRVSTAHRAKGRDNPITNAGRRICSLAVAVRARG